MAKAATPFRLEGIRHFPLTEILCSSDALHPIEGGDHGTPLMGACAAGRFATAKPLVSNNAKTCYTMDGEMVSALDAAKHFSKHQAVAAGWGVHRGARIAYTCRVYAWDNLALK